MTCGFSWANRRIESTMTDARSANCSPFVAVVLLLRRELGVPAQDCVGSHDRGEVQWRLPVEAMAFHREDATSGNRFLPSFFSNASIWSFLNAMVRCWCSLIRPQEMASRMCQGWRMKYPGNSAAGGNQPASQAKWLN